MHMCLCGTIQYTVLIGKQIMEKGRRGDEAQNSAASHRQFQTKCKLIEWVLIISQVLDLRHPPSLLSTATIGNHPPLPT